MQIDIDVIMRHFVTVDDIAALKATADLGRVAYGSTAATAVS